MTDSYILAAKISYEENGVQKILRVTDDASGPALDDQQYQVTEGGLFVPYIVNGQQFNVKFSGIFFDGEWTPRIASDIRWSESARHPYQEQGGEISIGDLILVNEDGGLDFLLSANVVGFTTDVRRGGLDQEWDDFERIFVARNSDLRVDGRSRVVISLENVLLNVPVFDEEFDDQTPNPQLIGGSKPFVLGRVKQAPLLEFDPVNLEYFPAENQSKITEVQEGGNPTFRWTSEERPLVRLKANPSLGITADFEGEGENYELLFDGLPNISDFNSITATDGNTASVTEVSDGIDLTIGGSSTVTAPTHENKFAASLPKASTANVGFANLSTVGNNRNQWSNPENIIEAAGSASLTLDDDLVTDDLVFSTRQQNGSLDMANGIAGFAVLDVLYACSGSNNVFLNYVDFYKISSGTFDSSTAEIFQEPSAFMFRFNPERQSCSYLVSEFYNYFSIKDLTEQRVVMRLGFGGDDGETISVSRVQLTNYMTVTPLAGIEFDQDLNHGELIYAEVDYETTAGRPMLVAAGRYGFFDSFETGVLEDAIKFGGVSIQPSGTIKTMIRVGLENTQTANQDNRVRFYITAPSDDFGPDYEAGTVRITNIKISRGKPVTPSYKDLVPYVLQTAGIDPAVSLEQSMINEHADALGDPDMGWLIRSNETIDEVLFRLAGSLFGYVWYGLDGKIRSKVLELPQEPVGDFLTIDKSRVDPNTVVSFDDPAPRLTKTVRALRNWEPIPSDRQAGILQSWYADDRAAVSADYRITRRWQSTPQERQEFNSKYPSAAGNDPYDTALLDAATAQDVANRGPTLWKQIPRFYEMRCYVRLGELSLVEVGKTVKVQLDYPSLADTPLLVLGREGDSTSGFVNLILWGIPQ